MEAASSFFETVLGLSAKAEQLSTLQICLRALIVYLVLIGYVRFAKKRFLGEATAVDAILMIMIGSIASRAISGTAPFVPSLGGTLTLIVVHWIISYFTESWKTLSYFIKGHDTLIIKNGRIDHNALRAAHMSSDDLAEDLREKGVKSPSEVEEAHLERSGKLSVIKKK